MRSKLDRHFAAGPTPAWSRRIQSVDGSYPHFRSLPSSQLCRWGKTISRKEPRTQLHCWDSSHSRPNFAPTRMSESSLCCGFYPRSDRHIQSIARSHPHFRPLFAGKHSREPVIARNIWYIHECFLIRIFPSMY